MALVELNPLAILKSGELAVLDGKVNSDDNATFRHPDLAAMRDIRQEDETEVKASQYDLNYVTMDGNIGCMRSEEHTSELQSLMRISYAVFCLKKKKQKTTQHEYQHRLYDK